jgi:hypothetical protein
MVNRFGVPTPSQPYFGSGAQQHSDYLSRANDAANAVESIYALMQGHNKDERGRPRTVRDVRDLKAVQDQIKEAEELIKTIKSTFKEGQYADADYLIKYAEARLRGAVQEKYNKTKASINEGLQYDKQVAAYDKQQAEMARNQRKFSTESDLNTLSGQEKHLFQF